jgi:transcriptional regulator with XRE-family HTH domain
MDAATEFRSRREAIAGQPAVSLREVARRSGLNPGRLSIIERGVEPTWAERVLIDKALGELELERAQAILEASRA